MIPYLPLQALNAAYEPMLSDAVQRVVQSGWYLNGKELAAFEQEFAAYLDVAHCVGVGNGLDALTLILLALREMEKSRFAASAAVSQQRQTAIA